MQIANKANRLVAFALAASMLMDTSSAVEVTAAAAPSLPDPATGGQTFRSVETPQPAGPATVTPSADSFILGARSFAIPFTVDGSGAEPLEVQLFVARGASDSWQMLASQRPTSGQPTQFEFTADGDGEFWFATRTIDAKGQPHPGGKIGPQLKVFVDTARPDVTLNADADADGRVDAEVVVQDDTPIKSLQLRYVTDRVSQWQNVDLQQLPANGKVQFTPAQPWQQLSLQVIATDAAGNLGVVNRLLQRPRIATAPGNRFAATAVPPTGIPPTAVPSTAASKTAVSHNETRPAPYRIQDSHSVDVRTVAGPVNPSRGPTAIAPGYAGADNSGSALGGFRGAALPATAAAYPQTGLPQSGLPQSGFPQTGFPPSPFPPTAAVAPQSPPATYPVSPQLTLPPSLARRLVPATGASTSAPEQILPPPASLEQISNGFGLSAPQQSAPQTNPTAQTNPAPQSIPAPQAEPEPSRPRTLSEAMRPLSEQSAVPPKQEEVPTPQAEPDGAATRQQAKRLSPADPALMTSRVPVRFSDSERFSLEYELEAVGSRGVEAIELYGSIDNGKTWKRWGTDPDQTSPFDIETRQQGVFGFRIVVVGRNGLASPRPQPGETPDIIVVVDTEAPTARLTGAQYGEGNRIGSLIIQYECQDVNLMQRPIALSFSDSLEGPWTTIAAGLQNDGDYVWPADPNLPRQIYLRIDATDQAGNVGTYILDRPIDTQGLAPRARIRGFQSLSGGPPPMAGEQTAQGPTASFK